MSRTSRLFALFFVVVLGVSALYVSLPGAPTALAQACPASSFTVTPGSVPNNGTPSSVVFSTGVNNTPVTVTTTPASLPAGVSVLPQGSQTDGSGNFTVLVSSSAQLSVASSVSVNLAYTAPPSTPCSISGAQVTFTQAPADAGASSIQVTSTPPHLANGVQPATIRVVLLDASFKGTPGRSVSLSVTSGDPAGVTISPNTPQTTGENGTLTWSVTSTLPKTIQLTANNTTDGFNLGPVSVTFFPAPPHHGSAAATPATALASGADPVSVEVTVLSEGNSPIQGCTVSLSGTYPSFVSITPSFGTTNPQGKAFFTATSTGVVNNQAFQFSVTGGAGCGAPASPLVLTSNTVNFTRAPALPPPTSSITPPAGPIPADGVTTGDIVVTLKNVGNNPVQNEPVTLTANPATGVSISSSENNTGTDGVITFKVASSVPGTVTFTTNTIDGFTLSTTADFVAAPADKGQSTVTRSPASGDIPGDGVSAVTVTVTLKNVGGGAVGGHTVTLAPLAAAPGLTIAPNAGASDPANGVHAFTVTAITPSAPLSVTLRATDSTQGLVLDDAADLISINFVVPPADAALSIVDVENEVPPNPLGVEANNVATATIHVTVRDRADHALPGKTVQLDPNPATGVSFVPPGANTAVTDGSGVATFVVKSSQINLVTFTATVTGDNVVITDTAQINFVDAPATQATITIAPGGSLPGNGQATSEATITVVLRNAGNGFAVGKSLYLDATGAPNEAALIYPVSPFQATNANGTAVFKVRSSVAQTVTFTLRNQTDPAPWNIITPAPVVTWVASTQPVAGANSSISLTPTTANANGSDTVTITAILRDANGTVVAGKTARLVPSAPLPAGVTVTPGLDAAASNNNGEATWTVRSTAAGTFTFTATVPSDFATITNVTPGGSNTVTFNPVGSAVNATNSSVQVLSGNPALANGTAQITLRVTLRDAANNPLQGLPVSLSSSRASQDAIAPGSINTNASGQADFTVTSNTAGDAQITAVGDGVTLSTRPTITFNPLNTGVDPDNSSISVSGSAPANGTAQITVVVTVRNAANNPVQGQVVTLTSSRGSPVPDNIQPAFRTSAADGTAQFTITSTQAGSGTLRAVANGTTLTVRPQFTFDTVVSPVDPATSTVAVAPASVPANGTSAILVTVTVRQGATALNGIPVSVSTNPPVTVSAVNGTSNGSGQATFELRSTVAHPSVTVIAVADGVTIQQQPVVAFDALPVDAGQSTIAANPLSVAANGVATSTITVTLRDVNGNPVSGRTVTVTSSRFGTDTIAPLSGGSNVSNSNGQATFTVRSNTVGNAVLSASADAVTITPTVTVGFTSGVAVNAVQSTISVTPPGTAPADGTSSIQVQVTVRDASSNPLPSRAVTLSAAPGGVTFTPATALSDTNGVATFALTSTTAGQRTLTAVADGVTLTPATAPTVTFTAAAAISPTLSTLSASPASVPANGTTPITVTVTVRDTNGTALAGRAVTISSSRGATDTIATISGTTNASGQATFEVRSSTVGSPVISASASGTPLTNTVTIGFASTATVSPTLSTIAAQNSPQPAGGTPITVVVHVVDASNTALVGKSVTITPTPNTGITITPGSGTTVTDASGNATFQVSSPNAGIITISAVADGQALTNTAQITFQAPLGPPDLAITKSGQATFNAGVASPFIIAVNNVGSGPTTGTITVTDTLPVGMRFWGTLGDTQGFSCGAAGQVVTCNRSTALANGGVASFQILANPDPAFFTTAQNLSNTASVTTTGDTNTGNNTSAALFFNVTPINLNQIFEGNSTVTVNPTSVPADNTSAATITITLRNIQNQPVAGATVTLTPSVASGVTVASTATTTDANGAISFTAKSSVNQTVQFTIIATSSAGSVTFANKPQVVFGTGGTGGGTGTTGVTSPTTSTVLADCSSIPANNVAQATIQVTLKDASNNPVAGKTVTLTANPAPATLLLTPVSGTTSGADGTVRWTVRSSAQGSSIFTASTTDGQLIFINQTATVTFGAPNSQSTCQGLPSTTATGTAIAGVDQNLLNVPTGPITGRVVAWRLRVRTGPGLDYQILGLLRLGTEVSIVARNSRTTWFMIQLNEGTAWVSANWIRVTRSAVRRLPVVDDQPGTAPIVPVPSQLIPLVGEGIGRVNTYLLRVRVGPGLSYQQVGLLREGTEILLLGISPDRAWYKIRTDDGDRWVSAFYVRVIRINGQRLPVVEPEPRP